MVSLVINLKGGKTMHRSILSLTSLCIAVFCLILLDSCASSVPNIDLKPEHGFSNQKAITVYIIPSGRKKLDETYARATVNFSFT